MDLPASVVSTIQQMFDIVPTRFMWFKVGTPKGPMVLLICVTASGMQGYFMPPVTAKELSEGLVQVSSQVHVATEMPKLTPQDEAWLRDKDPKGGQ